MMGVRHMLKPLLVSGLVGCVLGCVYGLSGGVSLGGVRDRGSELRNIAELYKLDSAVEEESERNAFLAGTPARSLLLLSGTSTSYVSCTTPCRSVIRVRSKVMHIVNRGPVSRFGGWAEHELEFFVEFLKDFDCLSSS